MKRLPAAGMMLLAVWTSTTARASAPPCRYTVYSDTVLDNETGLLWQRSVPGAVYLQADAGPYCQSLSLGGSASGWRLPESLELMSLVDPRGSSPSIDASVFPGSPTDYHWSATKFLGSATQYWAVGFNSGGFMGPRERDWAYPVRCVRSPSLNFTSGSQSTTEGRTVTATVLLSAIRGAAVSVPYTLSGTATPGVDYSVSPASPLVIPAGQSGVTITFDFVLDETTEGGETVTLGLGTPTNAALGTTTAHTVSIADACAPDNEWWEWPVLPDGKPDSLYTWTANIVYDTVTLRTWQREVSVGTYSQPEANTYCQNLNLDGTGWRLPTVAELKSIADRTRSSPSINTTAFPNTPAAPIWTSSPATPETWRISFDLGTTENGVTFGAKYHVRCVR